ncbi:MAG TPA: DUF1592 domain-containing protein [Cellvibrio sp.]|nr:DUF1592 domain-containing protein [Cellvibrio sp.]
MRLLTREEYLNSVRDLFPSVTIDASVIAYVPADPSYFNFASESSLALDNERTLGYQMAAESIAKQVLAAGNLWDLIHTCRQVDIVCQVGLIGKTIFRRPLTVGEADRYAALYDAADAGKAVLQALLTSPHFLYRSEMGVETSPGSGVYRLDNYEIATLLSYSFWASTPDSQLLSAAAQENFDIKQQVKRMLADPRAERGLRRFVRGWLLVGNRGYSSVPGWSLASAFDEETIRFTMEMIKADKPFNSLLKAEYTYANAELALFYGSSPVSSGWAQSTFADGDSRRGTGILGHASFLAARGSDSDNPSPAQRGKFVREQLLCQKISGHGFIAVAPQPNETHRAAITRHTADPACSSCHQLINGIGFGLDRFGSNALYRTQEKLGNGQLQTIDASGWIKGLDSAETQLDPLGREVAFASVAELAGLIADSKLASACYSRQYYRYIVGRDEDAADESIIPLYSAKLRAGGGMLEMLTDLAIHPSFILRR